MKYNENQENDFEPADAQAKPVEPSSSNGYQQLLDKIVTVLIKQNLLAKDESGQIEEGTAGKQLDIAKISSRNINDI